MAYRLTADGRWWGARGYWLSATSPDGAWRWDGQSWTPVTDGQAPDSLEALDPSFLAANQRGRISARQFARLAPRIVLAALAGPASVGSLSLLDPGCLFMLVIGLAFAVIALPVAVVVLLLEWGLGARTEEGPLLRVYDGRRRVMFAGETAMSSQGLNVDRMEEGAVHRLYFTRITHSLINYERLGGAALARFEPTISAPPKEVAVWASDLKAGRLPHVCARSGQPADAALTFWFATNWSLLDPGRQATGPLPLTKRWRKTFIALRATVFIAAGASAVAAFSLAILPEQARPTVLGVSFGAFVIAWVVYFAYVGLRPKGELYANAAGERYVVLRDVDAAFAAAVRSMPYLPEKGPEPI
jgi:hypothetical protein